MNINGKGIKEKLAKGFILLTLTGTLVSKNPVGHVKETVVHAAVDLTEVKNDKIAELKAIYKKYNKKYYTKKSYSKITNYYNKGVKGINKATSEASIDSYFEKYSQAIEKIKPKYLVNYQKKMETKFSKSYKSLLSKNTYSDNNLTEMENIKEEGIKAIYGALTKTQSKKVKNIYTNKLKDVKTLIQESKDIAYNYINSNNAFNDEIKKQMLEEVDNMTDPSNVESFIKEIGYVEEEVYVETNPNKLTAAILNDEEKLEEFAKNWFENYPIAPGYYFDLDGKPIIGGWNAVELMMYMINYDYCKKSNALNSIEKAMDYSYSDNAKGFLEMCIGGSLIQLKRGNIMDYNTLIIENNDTKGIGKLLNDMEKAVIDDDQDKLQSLYKKYMDKYMNKNIVIDYIIKEISKQYVDSSFDAKYYEQSNKIIFNGLKIYDIEKEYFLNEYEKKYNKTKKLTN